MVVNVLFTNLYLRGGITFRLEKDKISRLVYSSMDKEGEIRVQSCSQNLFRPLKSGKLGPNLRIPSVPRGFSACTAGRKAEKRDGVWLEGVEENGNQYVK